MDLAGLPVRQLSSLNRARAASGNRTEPHSCSAKGANPSHLSASLNLSHTIKEKNNTYTKHANYPQVWEQAEVLTASSLTINGHSVP